MDRDPRGRWPLRLSTIGIVAFGLGPLAAKFEIVPPFVGFLLFAAGGALGLVGALGGMIGAFRGATSRRVRALMIGAVPAALLVALGVGGSKYPPINDITTDLSDPPALTRAADLPENIGRDMAYPESFKEIVREAYPDLQPLRLGEPPARVYERSIAIVTSDPAWQTTSAGAGDGMIEATVTSNLFRFRDDVAIRIRPDGEGSIVDVRSKSRDGRGDLGANAERIRWFLAKLAKPE